MAHRWAPKAFSWHAWFDNNCAHRGRRALRPTEGTPAALFARFSGLCRRGQEAQTKPCWDERRTTVQALCSAHHPGHRTGAHATRANYHNPNGQTTGLH